MTTTFRALINKGRPESIGELPIIVSPEPTGFMDAPAAQMDAGLVPPVLPPGPGEYPINFGSAATGGFAYSLAGAAEHSPAIGNPFPHGAVGLLRLAAERNPDAGVEERER